MNTFSAIILAIAFALAFICSLRVTELKDELAMLKAEVRCDRRTGLQRYKELKESYKSEYDEIAKIYDDSGE